MLISYKPPFKKFVKKQPRSFQLVIEDEVEAVIQMPLAGEGKKGDLTGFRIHKFSYKGQKFLLSYVIQTERIIFFTIGSHENFYRELKKYLKEVD
jgi:mRNA-degrading endonuclease RelE of RelBE toxin-antitoxin system